MKTSDLKKRLKKEGINMPASVVAKLKTLIVNKANSLNSRADWKAYQKDVINGKSLVCDCLLSE